MLNLVVSFSLSRRCPFVVAAVEESGSGSGSRVEVFLPDIH